MLKSSAPAIITVPFASGASGGYRNTIPIPSQIPITPGAASWTDGFPPLTMTATGAGGIPPYGQDMNGLGFALSTINQWTQLGFVAAYSSSVSTAIGGYPQGACIGQLSGLGYWLSTADNNTTNPDTTGSTNWVSIRSNAGRSTISVATGTVTPDPSVLGVPLLVLSGTLTGNVTLVLPLTQPGAGWAIYNATTGAFTVNVQGATGTGVTATQGSLTDVRTDGTNYYTGSLSGGPFLPLHATADAATKLATARTIASTGDVSWTSAAFDGTANVTGTATIAAGAVTLAKMANLTGNTLIGNPTGSGATPVAVPLVSPLAFVGGALGMSYTPVNKAGDSGIGSLSMTVMTAGNATITTNSTSAASLNIQSTDAGGHNWFLLTAGSAWGGGLGAGTFVLYDSTTGGSTAAWDTSGNMTLYRGGLSISNGSVAAVSSNNQWTGLQLQNASTGGHSWRLLSIGSSWAGGLVAGYFTIYDDAGGNRLSIDPSGNVTIFNSLTVAGSINFGTSDRTLKDNITEVEPQPLHRASPLMSYRRWDTDKWGRGLIAQDLIAQQPLYGNEYLHVFKDNTSEPKLAISETKAALEEAWWCGREIDKLLERVARLEART